MYVAKNAELRQAARNTAAKLRSVGGSRGSSTSERIRPLAGGRRIGDVHRYLIGDLRAVDHDALVLWTKQRWRDIYFLYAYRYRALRIPQQFGEYLKQAPAQGLGHNIIVENVSFSVLHSASACTAPKLHGVLETISGR